MNQATHINQAVFAVRKRTNAIGLFLSMAAMTLGMLFLLWILSILFDISILVISYLFLI